MISSKPFHIIFKNGEPLCSQIIEDPAVQYVGGSPVSFIADDDGNLVVAGFDPTNTTLPLYNGVAFHSKEKAEHVTSGLVTVIRPPAILRIYRGSEDNWAGTGNESDEVPPYTVGGLEYFRGQLLRPTNLTVGVEEYAVWTNVNWTLAELGLTADDLTPLVNYFFTLPYFAKILDVEGPAASPTYLTIELGIFFKVVADADLGNGDEGQGEE